MYDKKMLGKRIREARNRAGLSQQQLASAIGVSDKTISAYEVGRVDPPLESLDKLSTVTKHPVGFFIGDVSSNIEARLNSILFELEEICGVLKDTGMVKTSVVKEAMAKRSSLSSQE
ncbi:MAG TPA: hypothetical protein DCX25_04665 [Candidatus Pacebacteria bacterium]|nr:MAG: Helix-turn-helix protein [Microgenomates group bacterium GW2011_GWB1_45_17]KKU23381.1 MAG: Helix-turn-helix protein [Microgenomates group bacterium GW2011_GWA1_46_15]KKU24489.1 MAG: Helix-turn-helix protein [Microgenomates group bacterium GW2011_GWC1_46_15]HAV15593.1 hypothetical protein [Candidatus Paceibacterota bacterium]HCR10919.1 hypothetical protein [Candidatus Paceibacterota bacterium]